MHFPSGFFLVVFFSWIKCGILVVAKDEGLILLYEFVGECGLLGTLNLA